MSQTLTVSGMHCEHCEETVEDALEGIESVTAATADHDTGAVTVDGGADPDTLVSAIEEAGYDTSV